MYFGGCLLAWIVPILFLWAISSTANGQDMYMVVQDFEYLDDTNYCCQQCFCERDIGHYWVEYKGVKITNRTFDWEIAYEYLPNNPPYLYIYDASEIYFNVGDWGIRCDSFGGRFGMVNVIPSLNPPGIGTGVIFNIVQCSPVAQILPHRAYFCANAPIAILQNSRKKPTSYTWYISNDSINYSYYSNDTNFYVAELDVGSYYLKLVVANAKGIDSVYTAFEVIDAPPVVLPHLQAIEIAADTIVTLYACTIADRYNWYPSEGLSCSDCPSPLVNINSDASYTCITSNTNECSDTCYYAISLPFSIYVPNAFSPNGDGTNDTYTVLGRNIEVMDMMIYNSWGNEVYRGNLSSPWDGSYQGSTVSAGVYGYYLSYRNKKTNTLHHTNGNITVIR